MFITCVCDATYHTFKKKTPVAYFWKKLPPDAGPSDASWRGRGPLRRPPCALAFCCDLVSCRFQLLSILLETWNQEKTLRIQILLVASKCETMRPSRTAGSTGFKSPCSKLLGHAYAKYSFAVYTAYKVAHHAKRAKQPTCLLEMLLWPRYLGKGMRDFPESMGSRSL